MKKIIVALLTIAFLGCTKKEAVTQLDLEPVKKEVLKAEEDFKVMAQTKGIPEAFYTFADSNAVIKRENDTLIIGKENIKLYYSDQKYQSAKVTWTPDFVDVSQDGSMGYTYGTYVWSIKDYQGKEREFKGVFHTVWKKQSDGSWKYTWD
ncbi:YybH family protein [Flavobacterium sedimenticola]|uniref:Nuclear transport factor 2 family protein n=1 Tax=Flavobacterium sedimenticola TaxID=3043286 RepID=A0ABT6XNE4_9FLAO|nr:nuclear transport factor 2 family protein [Flavobacterium sedimenticola]MDI9256606.1 nuclear transport factor 2 family protein [Flavobacterium sedimenticola]